MRIAAPRSLIGQFALLHLLIAGVAMATLPFGVSMLLQQVAHHYQGKVLQQQAGAVAESLRTRDPAQAIASVNILAGGLTISVIDRSRHVLAERGPPRPGMTATVPLHGGSHLIRRGPLASVVRPLADRWIVVSQDDAAPEVVADDIVRTFLKRFALLLLPFTLLVALAALWLTRRLVGRLTIVAAMAAAIGPRTLDRRLPRGTLPSEVEPLAEATNAVLDRLEHSFTAQAAFAADVAHELRTPLAVIRLRTDMVADPALRDTLQAGVDRAARVIGQLLGLADLERPTEEVWTTIDLLSLVADVVADRAPAIVAAGRSIALDDRGPAPFAGSAGTIILAIENLIDNAARHTPSGTCIVVQAGPGAAVTILDDGPPIPPARLARMSTRFWRGDPHGEGSGLGLSIVARIAVTHGGALHLAAGPAGRGLHARLTFDPRPDQNRERNVTP